MSTSSFAYNSLDMGVSRRLTFLRRRSRLRHHSDLVFSRLFDINEEILCAKFGLLKSISTGDTKILSFLNRGLQGPLHDFTLFRYISRERPIQMFKFGTEQCLMDVEMSAKFGSKKPKAWRVISRFRRFVICGISFRRLQIYGI